jgi:hypothetical protein
VDQNRVQKRLKSQNPLLNELWGVPSEKARQTSFGERRKHDAFHLGEATNGFTKRFEVTVPTLNSVLRHAAWYTRTL